MKLKPSSPPLPASQAQLHCQLFFLPHVLHRGTGNMCCSLSITLWCSFLHVLFPCCSMQSFPLERVLQDLLQCGSFTWGTVFRNGLLQHPFPMCCNFWWKACSCVGSTPRPQLQLDFQGLQILPGHIYLLCYGSSPGCRGICSCFRSTFSHPLHWPWCVQDFFSYIITSLADAEQLFFTLS